MNKSDEARLARIKNKIEESCRNYDVVDNDDAYFLILCIAAERAFSSRIAEIVKGYCYCHQITHSNEKCINCEALSKHTSVERL